MRFDFEHSDFEKYKLGELVENVVAGATPKTSVEEYWDGGNIPWLSSGEVHKKYVYFTDKFITSEGYNNSSTKLVPKNSVLIALAGQGKTRGTVAINKIELCTNQSIASIIPNDNLYYKFLFYYLESKYDYLRALSSSDGGRGGLNLKLIRSIPIQIPSVDEQKVISNFINSIDKKITILERKYESYQDFKKYLMQQIFAQKLRFDYEEYTLKEICEKIENGFSGTQVPYKTQFPVTRIETISSGKINYEKVGFVDEISERYKLKNGDILLTNINSLKWIGNAVYYDGEQELYHGMNLMLLRTKKDFNSKYLYYYISYNNNWFKKMACQAVNQASINKTTLEKFKIKFPSITDQNNISNVLTLTDEKIQSIQNKIELTNKFKKGLLQQMFVVQLILSLLQNKKHI